MDESVKDGPWIIAVRGTMYRWLGVEGSKLPPEEKGPNKQLDENDDGHQEPPKACEGDERYWGRAGCSNHYPADGSQLHLV